MDAGHRHGRGQIGAGPTHNADDAGADWLSSPGEQISLARDNEPAVIQDFQGAKFGVVVPGGQPCQARKIADQNDPLGRFGADKGFDHRRWQMVPIDDQSGRQPIVSQLVPKKIRMATQHRMGAISQMGAKRRSSVDNRADLGRVGRRVTDGHSHAAGDNSGNELRRSLELRRHRDQPDLPLGGLGPQGEFFGIGRAAVSPGVRAPWTVFGRNVGPFQMNARDQRSKFRRLAAGFADGRQAGQQRFATGGGERGAKPRDAEGRQPLPDRDHLVGRKIGRVEFMPTVAINLQVDKAWRQPGQIRIGRCARPQTGDALAGGLDFDHLRRGIMTTDYFHGAFNIVAQSSRCQRPAATPFSSPK